MSLKHELSSKPLHISAELVVGVVSDNTGFVIVFDINGLVRSRCEKSGLGLRVEGLGFGVEG